MNESTTQNVRAPFLFRAGLMIAAAAFLSLSLAAMPQSDPASKVPDGKVHGNLPYATIDGVDPNLLSLDIHAPQRARKLPVLVMIHGGGWRGGDKANKSAVEPKARHFNEAGYLFVSVNYRLSPAVQHPAHVTDVAAALAWIAAHIGEYGGDSKTIFVMGHSAGAHLAALVATDGSYLEAAGAGLAILDGVILLDSAAYDMPRYLDELGAKKEMRWLYESTFGSDPAVLRDASPQAHVEAGKGIPPFLIFHAGNRMAGDVLSADLAAALVAAGGKAEAVSAAGKSHSAINREIGTPEDAVTAKIMEFLEGARAGIAQAGNAPTGAVPTDNAPTGTAPTGTAPTGTAPTGIDIADSDASGDALRMTREGTLHFKEAAEYSAARMGISMLVMIDGEIVFEDYPNGGSPGYAHELASGTKSFSGVLAAAAAADGLLALDEKVSDTIVEWKEDPQKEPITIRRLLNLTSGIGTGGERGRVPIYTDALAAPVVATPGERFLYGPVPFQIFGEVMRRKLEPRGEGVLGYLEKRILDPVGIEYGRWNHHADDQPHLPSGAALTARNWALFGELVRRGGTWKGKEIVPAALLDECFAGSEANPAYGLTWWLNPALTGEQRSRIEQLRRATDLARAGSGLPADLVFAAGAGKQRLYVSRSLKLVVVRQAEGIGRALRSERSGFSDLAFLSLLLRGELPARAADDAGEGREGGAGTSGTDRAAGNASSLAAQAIERLDANGDGKLTRDEVPARLHERFDRADSDGDGTVTVEELARLLGQRRRR